MISEEDANRIGAGFGSGMWPQWWLLLKGLAVRQAEAQGSGNRGDVVFADRALAAGVERVAEEMAERLARQGVLDQYNPGAPGNTDRLAAVTAGLVKLIGGTKQTLVVDAPTKVAHDNLIAAAVRAETIATEQLVTSTVKAAQERAKSDFELLEEWGDSLSLIGQVGGPSGLLAEVTRREPVLKDDAEVNRLISLISDRRRDDAGLSRGR